MIIPATIEHMLTLDARLPGIEEYWKRLKVTHEQGMREEIGRATEAWAWTTPELGAVFGLTHHNFTDAPVFWLYPGPAVRTKRFAFLRECKRLRPYFVGKYPNITGFCNIQFEESVRFLQWMGATVEPPIETDGLTLSLFNVQN